MPVEEALFLPLVYFILFGPYMTSDCGLAFNELPRFLAISDQNNPFWPGWEGWIEKIQALDVMVQIREKSLEIRDLMGLCRRVFQKIDSPFVVNSRPDLAQALDATGVHLTSTGYPVSAVRRRFGSALLIGRSTHTLSEVVAAHQEGADYVTFGPIYPTPGKGNAKGLASLREVVKVGIPVYALGGISWENVEIIRETGAWGVAGIRLFFTTPSNNG